MEGGEPAVWGPEPREERFEREETSNASKSWMNLAWDLARYTYIIDMVSGKVEVWLEGAQGRTKDKQTVDNDSSCRSFAERKSREQGSLEGQYRKA